MLPDFNYFLASIPLNPPLIYPLLLFPVRIVVCSIQRRVGSLGSLERGCVYLCCLNPRKRWLSRVYRRGLALCGRGCLWILEGIPRGSVRLPSLWWN